MRDGEVVVLPADSKLHNGWKRKLQGSSYLVNYLAYLGNCWQAEMRRKRAHRQAVELAAVAEREAHEAARAGPAAETAARADPSSFGSKSLARDQSSTTGPVGTHAPHEPAPALPGDAIAQIAVTRHYLAKWKRDCDDRRVRFIVVYIPGVTELDEGGNAAIAQNDRAYRQAFFSCAEAAGIETIDLLPGMWAAKHAAGIGKLLIPGDGHWTATAHQIVADIIASRLRDTSTARR